MKKQILTKILVAALATLAVASCGDTEAAKGPSTDTEAARPVLVTPVAAADAGSALTFSGVVRAQERARLAFAVPGRIAQRTVSVGDRVSKGQVIAKLESNQFQNARSGAQAGLAEAKARRSQLTRDKARVSQLVQTQAASHEELENVASALESVEAKVSGAKVQVREAARLLSDSRIVAPFDGVISEEFAEVGEYAQPGAPIVALTGDGALEVEVAMPESALAGLSVGNSVHVRLPMLGVKGLEGTIQSIAHSTRAGKLFPVIISLAPHEALMPGVTAELVVERDRGHAFALPVSAIVSPSGDAPSVFRVREGVANRVAVKTLTLQGRMVLVQGALAPGDAIVVAGHANLVDGQAVSARALESSPLHKHLAKNAGVGAVQ